MKLRTLLFCISAAICSGSVQISPGHQEYVDSLVAQGLLRNITNKRLVPYIERTRQPPRERGKQKLRALSEAAVRGSYLGRLWMLVNEIEKCHTGPEVRQFLTSFKPDDILIRQSTQALDKIDSNVRNISVELDRFQDELKLDQGFRMFADIFGAICDKYAQVTEMNRPIPIPESAMKPVREGYDKLRFKQFYMDCPFITNSTRETILSMLDLANGMKSMQVAQSTRDILIEIGTAYLEAPEPTDGGTASPLKEQLRWLASDSSRMTKEEIVDAVEQLESLDEIFAANLLILLGTAASQEPFRQIDYSQIPADFSESIVTLLREYTAASHTLAGPEHAQVLERVDEHDFANTGVPVSRESEKSLEGGNDALFATAGAPRASSSTVRNEAALNRGPGQQTAPSLDYLTFSQALEVVDNLPDYQLASMYAASLELASKSKSMTSRKEMQQALNLEPKLGILGVSLRGYFMGIDDGELNATMLAAIGTDTVRSICLRYLELRNNEISQALTRFVQLAQRLNLTKRAFEESLHALALPRKESKMLFGYLKNVANGGDRALQVIRTLLQRSNYTGELYTAMDDVLAAYMRAPVMPDAAPKDGIMC